MLPKQSKVFQNIFNYFLSGVAFVGAFLIFPFKFFSILYLKVRRGIFLVSSKYKQEGFTDNICFWPGTTKIFSRVNLEYLSYITLRLILKINLSLENVKTQTKMYPVASLQVLQTFPPNPKTPSSFSNARHSNCYLDNSDHCGNPQYSVK